MQNGMYTKVCHGAQSMKIRHPQNCVPNSQRWLTQSCSLFGSNEERSSEWHMGRLLEYSAYISTQLSLRILPHSYGDHMRKPRRPWQPILRLTGGIVLAHNYKQYKDRVVFVAVRLCPHWYTSAKQCTWVIKSQRCPIYINSGTSKLHNWLKRLRHGKSWATVDHRWVEDKRSLRDTGKKIRIRWHNIKHWGTGHITLSWQML